MKKKKRIRIVLGVLLPFLQIMGSGASESTFDKSLSGNTVVTQDRSSWKRFTGADEEFSILMPGAPSLHVDSVTTKFRRTLEERIYSSYSEGKLYLVVLYPGLINSFEDVLNLFQINHHANDVDLTFERDLSFENGAGKQYRWRLNGTPGTLEVVLAKKHSYVVAVVQAVDDPSVASYFLSSFSLSSKGRNVVSIRERNPDKTFGSGGLDGVRSAVPASSEEPEKIFVGRDVNTRAVVVSRPQPSYTEEARRKQIMGAVVVRAVLTSDGEVRNIKIMLSLDSGLDEMAIQAARHLRFIPAIKDGKFVSSYLQIEYSFNLY